MNKTVREQIVDLLIEIEKEASYAQLVLKRALQDIDAKDKGFVTEVVYGTLKYQIKLDYILNQFSKTPVHRMKPLIRNVMRMSLYQMLYLDKVPTSAIINEAVKIVKKRKFQNLSGFVNGILRNIDRQREQITYPDETKNLVLAMSIHYAIPEWMIEDWLKVYKEEEVKSICEALNERAEVCVRYNTLKTNKLEFEETLKVEGIQLKEGAFLEEAFYLKGVDNLQNSPSFKKGEWTVQDESAMLVAHVMAPQKGDCILDMCSAPGGKSIHMAELMANEGRIVSCDIHPHKLELIKKNAKRMGITIIEPTLQDGTLKNECYVEAFDKVLLDAPCSGLGIMKRKPDIRTHKSKEGLLEIVALQKKLALAAISYLKPGGRLVYSTCTISHEENEGMVSYIKALGLELENIVDTIPNPLKKAIKEKGMIQILPHMAGTDGFFIASFKKGV
ncbi:16S rRNA (cytosine(967)-C(5))-methyltransferase RsmB [Cellulosilyticum sp. WCF-2]|uniref:16S rRNA (cytosine(967)-C(5))-methyltransferase RsmB n=1 Tax=Cellulosilyticum sp. WCF-2 TaxID=2497860 RepID=UPI000F8CCB91|nr:16S rRNA (cytosine(967)-C(5))-methyltransferase RsmB [Cellulosilyticum sp. WCF-2]QEH68946.1 16S rRNA (cytosine(967)-C(5))-methyltransferase RsmB [Cellulosilyticum sp. WCF-2]